MADAREQESELARLLARGPAGALELQRALGISQPAFSRLAKRMRERLLVVGRARATRYALRRMIPGVGEQAPIYEIGEDGTTRTLSVLHFIEPSRFYLEAAVGDVESAFYDDLPYFLDELRPSGFLGRLIPRRHPELELPSDIQRWSTDHCLRYVTNYGWNLSGSLIAGDAAFRLYLENSRKLPDVVDSVDRERLYPAFASDVLAHGAPGSSAAGEQPKFLAVRELGAVLVKFSPPVMDATSQRLSDLLVAEHVALETVRAHGQSAAKSELLRSGGRTFLEVERFDRLPNGSRRGLISLLALDAQFVGRLRSWSDSAEQLHARGLIGLPTLSTIRWLELFGRLIANTDMHAGNLSFFGRGTTLVGLAPAYDMGPSFYAPRQGHLETLEFDLPVPSPADAPVWKGASSAADEFWSRIGRHPLVSEPFRDIAQRNQRLFSEWRALATKLPAQ